MVKAAAADQSNKLRIGCQVMMSQVFTEIHKQANVPEGLKWQWLIQAGALPVLPI
jgi:hypothetical protein